MLIYRNTWMLYRYDSRIVSYARLSNYLNNNLSPIEFYLEKRVAVREDEAHDKYPMKSFLDIN